MDLRLLAAAALGAAFSVSATSASAGPAGAAIGPQARSVVPGAPQHFFPCRDGGRHDGRGDGRFGCGGFTGAWIYDDGQWARYNNRSWDPDSYNDWWNDRPDRAFPRWVQEQQARGTCDPDRMWWSGSGWHC